MKFRFIHNFYKKLEKLFFPKIYNLKATLKNEKKIREINVGQVFNNVFTKRDNYFGIYFLIIGLIALTISIPVLNLKQLFLFNKTEIVYGKVNWIEKSNYSTGKGIGKTPFWKVNYSYKINDEKYTKTDYVLAKDSIIEHLFKSKYKIKIEVDYFFNDVSRIDSSELKIMILLRLFAVLMFPIAGTILILKSFYQNTYPTILIYQYGILTEALLLYKKEASYNPNTKEVILFELFYEINLNNITYNKSVFVPHSGPYFVGEYDYILLIESDPNYFLPIKDLRDKEIKFIYDNLDN